MKFFGIEIKRARKESNSTEIVVATQKNEKKVKSPVKFDTSVFDEPAPKVNGPLSLLSEYQAIHPITAHIDWPNPPNLNPYQKTLYRNYLNNFNSFLINCRSFDYCPIRDISRLFPVILDQRGAEYFKIIESLHCVKFEMMEPEVIRSIPKMVSYILNGSIRLS